MNPTRAPYPLDPGAIEPGAGPTPRPHPPPLSCKYKVERRTRGDTGTETAISVYSFHMLSSDPCPKQVGSTSPEKALSLAHVPPGDGHTWGQAACKGLICAPTVTN